MPFAEIHVPEGSLTVKQRRAIVKGVTEVIAGVEQMPPSGMELITVLIAEVPAGAWGVAGHGYTPDEVPELMTKGARTNPDVPR